MERLNGSKVRLHRNGADEWQASLDVGEGHHAIGKTPWDALRRLADYCESREIL